VTHKQLYMPESNVLLTRFLSADGVAHITDFMPVGLKPDNVGYHSLVRRHRGARVDKFRVGAAPPSTTRAGAHHRDLGRR
jgi:hypothetical protein